MFIVTVIQAPDSDVDAEEFEFMLDDLVNAIDTNLPETSQISRTGNLYTIKTTLSEKEIKDIMEPAFSYHFENIRYVSIAQS